MLGSISKFLCNSVKGAIFFLNLNFTEILSQTTDKEIYENANFLQFTVISKPILILKPFINEKQKTMLQTTSCVQTNNQIICQVKLIIFPHNSYTCFAYLFVCPICALYASYIAVSVLLFYYYFITNFSFAECCLLPP